MKKYIGVFLAFWVGIIFVYMVNPCQMIYPSLILQWTLASMLYAFFVILLDKFLINRCKSK